MARSTGPLRLWNERVGLKHKPRTVDALARGAGLDRPHAWRLVLGEQPPRLSTLLHLAQELRVPVGAVAEACRMAVEDRKVRDAVERARLEAEAGE